MDTERFLTVPDMNDTAMDKYTASIELSNACRQFYKSRVEAAHCIKSRWERHSSQCRTGNDNDRPADDNSTARRQRNSIDEAMDKLRTEMTSLMEQDLSLMRQLLTLNETIEDLKWQRRYYYSPRSLSGSSTELDHSDCSISDTEMYDSDDDTLLPTASSTTAATSATATATITASPTCKAPVMLLSAPAASSSGSRRNYESSHVTSTHACGGEKRCVDSELLVAGSVKVYHGEQNSFDSGIHDSSCSEEEAVV